VVAYFVQPWALGTALPWGGQDHEGGGQRYLDKFQIEMENLFDGVPKLYNKCTAHTQIPYKKIRIVQLITSLLGDIPKKFQLTADELDIVEGCDNFETQKRLLDQIVIDRDLPVAMRTFQVFL
jgi:hypothetical protein